MAQRTDAASLHAAAASRGPYVALLLWDGAHILRPISPLICIWAAALVLSSAPGDNPPPIPAIACILERGGGQKVASFALFSATSAALYRDIYAHPRKQIKSPAQSREGSCVEAANGVTYVWRGSAAVVICLVSPAARRRPQSSACEPPHCARALDPGARRCPADSGSCSSPRTPGADGDPRDLRPNVLEIVQPRRDPGRGVRRVAGAPRPPR
mmetsp:Transcript_1940/g.6937  ORF Transcript_1940/g.6937 Transcript_1940/m.6937 type:complete len:213 (-) Transcript_1940:911-1549(-)